MLCFTSFWCSWDILCIAEPEQYNRSSKSISSTSFGCRSLRMVSCYTFWDLKYLEPSSRDGPRSPRICSSKNHWVTLSCCYGNKRTWSSPNVTDPHKVSCNRTLTHHVDLSSSPQPQGYCLSPYHILLLFTFFSHRANVSSNNLCVLLQDAGATERIVNVWGPSLATWPLGSLSIGDHQQIQDSQDRKDFNRDIILQNQNKTKRIRAYVVTHTLPILTSTGAGRAGKLSGIGRAKPNASSNLYLFLLMSDTQIKCTQGRA